MKRKPQASGLRPRRTLENFSRLPNQVVKHQVNPFLTIEDKTKLAAVNRSAYQNSLSESETMQCAKTTLKGLACTNAARGLMIGAECVAFCKEHINYVVRNFIELAERNDVVRNIKPWIRVTFSDAPHDDLTILQVAWNSRLQTWAGSVVDFDFSQPQEFNQEFSNEIPFTCQNETLGECVTHHFDFRSAFWQKLEIIWLLPEHVEMDAQEVKVGDRLVVLENQDHDTGFFALRILNKDFVHLQTVADKTRGFSCESKTRQGLECFDFLRATELEQSCLVYCDKNREINIRNVIDLITTNTVFGETHDHRHVALSNDWQIQVVNFIGERELLLTPEDALHHESTAGALVVSNMEDLNSGIQVIFAKREQSDTRLLRIWIQRNEHSIPIFRFRESDQYVIIDVQTANTPWAADVDLDVDLDVPD